MSPAIVALLCIPPFIVALGLLFAGYRRKLKERKGCEQLLALVKATEEEQKQAIENFLTQSLSYDKSAAGGKAADLLKTRKQFMRKLLLGFLHRDVLLIASLDNELSQMTNAYHRLEAKTVAATAAPAPNKTDGGGEGHVVRLQQENQRLRHEIHITLSTLNNMFAEYSSMFGNDEGDRNLSVSQIVDRMQQLSGGGANEALEKAEQADVASALAAAPLAEGDSTAPEAFDIVADAAAQMDDKPAALDGDGGDPSWDDAFAEAAKQNDP